MQQHLLDPEHRDFVAAVRTFIAREVAPHHESWERAGLVDRSVWAAAGRAGLLGFDVAPEFGGGGTDDIRYPVLLAEELIRAGATGLGFALHNDVVAPYLNRLATPEQQHRWLPGFCSGELVSAIAITEPAAGSDLQALTTSAAPDGDAYVLTGTKTFVTNGVHADLVIVAARTHPADRLRGGLSLLVVERGMPGFERGRPLEKIGRHAQDTAELFFDEVRVPAANLLGRPGRGAQHLNEHLQRERLSIAAAAVAGAETVFAETLEYCRTRTAFGQPIGSFQHNRFELAEMSTEIEIARGYVDQCLLDHNAGRRDAVTAARAKWWTTDLQKRVVDRCLQLHGGYGYMREQSVARAFVDTRMMPIYGGTNEIMKELIGRSLGV
ncbi:acyl-CoA dehydrogenase family protein [Streptacidiphilus rugosus]|uniref:acyl-CoA dehydrogenase family protein n=1 Tax=Streptacidiphilus rugosus TaxID=405783 RepID=UPI00056053AA|nr:acyl-CoA dehydrogenase family protein [Streptacidiphilus rugosus]